MEDILNYKNAPKKKIIILNIWLKQANKKLKRK
jgi:hypothetical protein